ncbi:MAG: hypothetical protein DHS20C21_18460 [Gemmatimonadota bacterium]|nr:MAG: hypothetical protein DHS20C21_18460 [Gemmatimonadota bacterium]
MSLTKGVARTYGAGVGEYMIKAPVRASVHVFEGSAVSSPADGFARPLTAAAGESFRGFAEEGFDNTAVGAANGDGDSLLRKEGTVILDVVGVTGVGDIGADVYASDDDTFTLSAGTNNVKIGKVVHFDSGTTVRVRFEAAEVRSVS